MIQNTFSFIKFNFLLNLLFFLLLPSLSFSQVEVTSNSEVFQKYWQYRNSFNRHFIVQDRESSGCVNDGIGFDNTGSTPTFAKAGYGLPATQLFIAPNGAGLVGRRVNSHGFVQDISWDLEAPDHEFNYLNFNSETLTELGHEFVMLSTEYELLSKSLQFTEAQKVLDEIFLGLQAVRRLDMQAQFFIDQMYENRFGASGDLKEVCNAEFFINCVKDFDSNCHNHWDSEVTSDNFVPDYSGYNGFPIREDADQNLKVLLTDLSDDSWNVDAIGGEFTVLHFNDIVNPNDLDHDNDPFAELVNSQMFLSHDQIINLFHGFIFIKKFIPYDASITTCNGDTYYPVHIMENIVRGIVDNFEGSRIVLPGSKENCKHPIKLSNCEGGLLTTTLWGIKKMANKILGNNTYKTYFWEKIMFYQGSNHAVGNESGRYFFIKSIASIENFSDFSNSKRKKLAKIATKTKWEILLLANDVLFPNGDDAVGYRTYANKDWFKDLLDTAPCGGPCFVQKDYNTGWPFNNKENWPDFTCPNIPNWGGNRWSGYNDEHLTVDFFPTRDAIPSRSNGLDYLTLHNLYSLKYPNEQDFYNPENLETSSLSWYGSPMKLYSSNILGPSIMPCNDPAIFLNKNWVTHPTNIFTWNSINLDLSSIVDPITAATFNGSSTIGAIGLTINKQHTISSNVLQEVQVGISNLWIHTPTTTIDNCAVNYHQIISSDLGDYRIGSLDVFPCEDFSVILLDFNEIANYNIDIPYTWHIERMNGTQSISGNNIQPLFIEQKFTTKYGYTADFIGPYYVTFTLDDCTTLTKTIIREPCSSPNSPNYQILNNPCFWLQIADLDLPYSIFPLAPQVPFNWKIESPNGSFVEGTTSIIHFEDLFMEKYGTFDKSLMYTVTLEIDGIVLSKIFEPLPCPDWDITWMKVNPNPSDNIIKLNIFQDVTGDKINNYTIPPTGLPYEITKVSNMSHILKTGRVFSNDETIDISLLSQGSYIITIRINQKPISQTLIISRQ